MPSTRAGAGRSKTTEESTSSSDCSMHTPSDNASKSTISASEASRSTHKMSPPPDANARLAEDAAVKESSEKATSTAPHTTRTIERIEVSSHARQEESHPTQQNPERSVAVKLRRVEGSTPTSIEGSLQRPPHAKKPTRDTDTLSVRSSHRRKAEAQAKLAVALREMELAEARTRVAQAELELAAVESDEEDGAELYERTQEVENWFIETGAGPTKDQRPAEIEEKKSDIQELAQVIMKLSEKSRDINTPRHVELPYFNGSCDEWLAFKRSYEDSAASYSNAQNLARLRRAIQGTAKEAVQSLLFTAEEPREVIKWLESRFGRPGALALAELDKMKNLSKVGENPSDICVFASKVKNAVETIKALKKPQYLSSPETLKAVVDKMPTSMKFRWFAYHRTRRDEELQELLLIEAFLEIEADMCGDFAPPEVFSEQKKVYRKPVHTVQEESKETYKKSCPTCEEEHFAIECKRFRDANIDEKWNIIKKARICFKCLRFKHSRLNCKAPVCKQCGRWHHTILHSDKPPVSIGKQVNKEGGASEETVASINNAKGEEKAYLKIIPVDLYGPKGHVRVLALLDEGSTITLLDASIAEQIGAKGNLERLTIETVGGKLIRKDSSQKIELRIKGAHRSDKRTIMARTIDDLKLSEQTINKDTVRNCQHLRTIENQILYVTERPKLLIGQDNWGLIVTRRLRKGKPSEPVASLTNLGWVLHGCESGANALVKFTHYGRANASEESAEEIVREHFQLESLGIQNRSPSNDSDRRAVEILEKTTKENPADDATRGIPIEFNHNARWFKGPAFLRQPEEEWPFRDFKLEDTTSEERGKLKVMTMKAVEETFIDLGRFSSWERLLRTMARVVAFTRLLLEKTRNATSAAARRADEPWRPQGRRQKDKKHPITSRAADKENKKRSYLPLEEEHLRKAEEILLRMSQNDSFAMDIANLRAEKPLESASRLKKIDVYMGDDGIVKLRSRTMKFRDEGIRKMNPVILIGKQTITRLLIRFYHNKFYHGNTATVINEIRQKYWILGLRAALKEVAHRCQWCRTRKNMPEIPPTGDLPSERLQHHQFPFSCTAVDYFGPMQVTIGRRVEKRWGALFTCLTTRAVHLELAPSLSTNSMIMALRRMAARRGTPRTIYSDNGTNFVGAKKELEEAAQERGVSWKFIPPGCPNMGGAWERLVRTVKTALTVVLNERSPPEEVLHTLMTEVEHIVNSRPLTSVSMDSEDEESLTPNHFLLGRSCGAMAPGEFDDKELIGKANWRTTQRLADHFWRRWVKEYLPLLMPRKVKGKETNDPKEGDIVLIVDATLPRNSWPRGEVIKTYPGPDGRVRVLDVRTTGGVLRRPTRRIVVLVPATSSLQEDAVQRTVGENVSDETRLP